MESRHQTTVSLNLPFPLLFGQGFHLLIYLKRFVSLRNQDYANGWRHKDESHNFLQKHDQDVVKKEKREEVELQIKKEIIETLKDELENLKISVDKDKAKGKNPKKDKGTYSISSLW